MVGGTWCHRGTCIQDIQTATLLLPVRAVFLVVQHARVLPKSRYKLYKSNAHVLSHD